MKTKKIGGVDLPASSFAFVGDENDCRTWVFPVYFPGDVQKTINHVKNALYWFSTTKIPDTERANVWRTIAGAAKSHGIHVGQQPEPVAKKVETAPPATTGEIELKAARAMGALTAERLLKQIGY